MHEKLMLIDGNSIINRAFYGILGPKMLSTSEGFYTNAIFGFINILIRFMNEEKPTHIVVAFDMKSPTFRHIKYEKYKAHRKGMPQELAMQLPVLKEVLDAMNIKRIELEGFEADDIIGTLAVSAEKEGIHTVIITGDKDALQLASQKIRIKMPTTRMGKTEVEEYDGEHVIQKYGVTPEQIIDVKALMGDPSDNIPGVPGVGEKTALELIKKFSSVNNIYSNIHELDIKERLRNILIENKELADMSKELATIELNAPVDFELCNCEIREYNIPELIALLKKLEFNSIIAKLKLNDDYAQVVSNNLVLEHSCLSDAKELQEIIKLIEASGEFAYFLVTNKGENSQIEPVGISICWEENKAVYIHLKDNENGSDLFNTIREILGNQSLKSYTFNAKPHYALFNMLGIESKLIDFDVMIAAYLINPAKEFYNLHELSNEFLNTLILHTRELLHYVKDGYKTCDVDKIARIACEQAAAILKLTRVLREKIVEYGLEKLYFDVELPLTKVLADMEKVGMMVDTEVLMKLSAELEVKIDVLTKDIIDLAGEKFNINSTKQLGVILFKKLGLPAARKTKTGYSTDAEVLESLASKHPIIDRLLEYRQMVKLKSTYIDGLKPLINNYSKRIHSNFNQTVTVTGRISSTEPNLQNIPIKLEMGKQVRKIFVSEEGSILVDADYSQIELRVLAHISKDEKMIEAFKNGEDIHRITASKIFGVKEEDVTPLMRSRAKTINFGILYGKREFSLAKDLGITRSEAKNYIDSYLEKYGNVKRYMNEIIEVAKFQGYVTTLLGRRRYLPEINSSNFNIRSSAERMALNTPIQGTAADIIKVAMVKVYDELKNEKLKSRLILQVHDELIIETRKEELEQVKAILRTCMESAIELIVPLEVDIHWGENWYDAK